MADHGDEEYELDADGRRILIGLTAEETAEFNRLDESEFGPPPHSQQDWTRPAQQRWLELHQKHNLAMQPFLTSSKTKH